MPYYGPTTQYQNLKNFMSKKGRMPAEFLVRYGFNPLVDGIKYEMVQAPSKILAENDVTFLTSDIGNTKVTFKVLDGNSANLIFDNGTHKIVLDYLYCTEMYPSFTVTVDDTAHYYCKKLSLETGWFMDEIIHLIPKFFSNALFDVYMRGKLWK